MFRQAFISIYVLLSYFRRQHTKVVLTWRPLIQMIDMARFFCKIACGTMKFATFVRFLKYIHSLCLQHLYLKLEKIRNVFIKVKHKADNKLGTWSNITTNFWLVLFFRCSSADRICFARFIISISSCIETRKGSTCNCGFLSTNWAAQNKTNIWKMHYLKF